jgi:hypothetical protein
VTDLQALRRARTFSGSALAEVWRELAARPEGFICTQAAVESQKVVGGVVWGYYADENPAGWLGQGEGGHDFLIVDGHILDFWAAAYYGQRPVWSLKADAAAILHLYGPRARWQRIDDRPREPRFLMD